MYVPSSSSSSSSSSSTSSLSESGGSYSTVSKCNKLIKKKTFFNQERCNCLGVCLTLDNVCCQESKIGEWRKYLFKAISMTVYCCFLTSKHKECVLNLFGHDCRSFYPDTSACMPGWTSLTFCYSQFETLRRDLPLRKNKSSSESVTVAVTAESYPLTKYTVLDCSDKSLSLSDAPTDLNPMAQGICWQGL